MLNVKQWRWTFFNLRVSLDIIWAFLDFLKQKDSRDESISSNTDVKRKAIEMGKL